MWDFAKVLGSIGALGFVIGLLYDWGYFAGVDLTFFTLLNYKDHLTALTGFVLPTLGVSLFWMAWRHRSREMVAGGWLVGTLSAWAGRGEIAGTPAFAAFMDWVIMVSSFFLIAYLVAAIIELITSKDFGTPDSMSTTMIGPAVLGLIGLLLIRGYYAGRSDIADPRFETQVKLAAEGNAPAVTEAVHLVRAIDDGLIVRPKDEPDRLVFLRKETVLLLARPIGAPR